MTDLVHMVSMDTNVKKLALKTAFDATGHQVFVSIAKTISMGYCVSQIVR